MTIMITAETTVRDDGRTCKATRRCHVCLKDVSVFVRPEDFEAFVRGEGYIQDLFPYLSAAERELLLSGTCGPCFEAIFPPDGE